MIKPLTFFRCALCFHVVSAWDIDKWHGCAKCGGHKIRPTNLSLWEKVKQLIKHPSPSAWNRMADKYAHIQ